MPPVAVYLDRSFLITVSRRHLSNGMGEILKMALMKHRELFELLETHGQYLLDTQFQVKISNMDTYQIYVQREEGGLE